MRVNKRLLEQMRSYAERRHTTLTAIVEQYFLELLEEDKKVVDAEQI